MITQKQFFIAGSICFLCIGIGNLITNIIQWELMILSSKFSAIFSNLFNFIIAFFFLSMLKDSQKKMQPLEEKDAEDIIRGLKVGEIEELSMK